MTASWVVIEDAARSSWPAAEVEALGGWRLRASGGFTSRANSVHVGTDVDPPDLDDRLAAVVAFYERRGLPPRLQVPLLHRGLLDDLRTRGWHVGGGADVLVGPIPSGGGDAVAISDRPEELLDVWWAVNRAAAEHSIESAALLRRIEAPVGFALARVDGHPVACGVGTVRDDLLGIAAMATVPAARGQGFGRRIIGALSAWGAGEGASACWLQVEADNAPAVALYTSLGLRRSYAYVYLERSA